MLSEPTPLPSDETKSRCQANFITALYDILSQAGPHFQCIHLLLAVRTDLPPLVHSDGMVLLGIGLLAAGHQAELKASLSRK